MLSNLQTTTSFIIHKSHTQSLSLSICLQYKMLSPGMRRMIKTRCQRLLLVTGTMSLLLSLMSGAWCPCLRILAMCVSCVMCIENITSSHMSEIPPATTDRTPGSPLTNQRPSWTQATNQRRAVLRPGLIS